MLRIKRSSLIKRIWKNRLQPTTAKNETAGSPETAAELESTLHALLKRLKESQLESLAQCLETRGGETGVCVPLPRSGVRVGSRTVRADVLLCQVFRWPELAVKFDRKRLPCCTHDESDDTVCCNPYHYCILIVPEVPGHEDICDIKKLSSKWKDIPPDDPLLSTETGGDPIYLHAVETQDGTTPQQFWCNVAYWENRQRVGRLYTVTEQSVNIFQQLPRGDGMCLSVLQDADKRCSTCGGAIQPCCPGCGAIRFRCQGCGWVRFRCLGCGAVDNQPADTTNVKSASSIQDGVRRTREKIGYGLTLSRESDGVWIYNRSEYAVFVNSPTLERANARAFTVHKVSAGHALKVFDYDAARVLEMTRDARTDGPYDANAIRVSFAKGWGASYSRQFIMSCPCWIEILLRIQR